MPTNETTAFQESRLRVVEPDLGTPAYNAYALIELHQKEVGDALKMLLADTHRKENEKLKAREPQKTSTAVDPPINITWDEVPVNVSNLAEVGRQLISNQFISAAQEIFNKRQFDNVRLHHIGDMVKNTGLVLAAGLAFQEYSRRKSEQGANAAVPIQKSSVASVGVSLAVALVGMIVPQVSQMFQDESQLSINRQYDASRNLATPEAPGDREIYQVAQTKVENMLERMRLASMATHSLN